MKPVNLYQYLSQNEYPGRGILIARTPCAKKIRVGYFIMGRSENSRNRVFAETEDGIRTEAFDASKMQDPSLIIYHPIRTYQNQMIITNGDQTDTIFEFLKNGKTFEDALRTRTFEPDGPNWTPRISAVVQGSGCKISILKSSDGDEKAVQRYFFEYVELLPGEGRIIHTYRENGNPIPSFTGEPVRFELEREPFDVFSENIWNALNEDNKVSLYTAVIEIETGEMKSKIFNKNQK